MSIKELLHYAQKTPGMLSDKNVDARGQKRIPEQIEESKCSPLFLYTNEL